MLFKNTKKYLSVKSVDKDLRKIKIKKEQNEKSCEKEHEQ